VATVNYKLEARLSVWVYISTYGRLLRGYKHLQHFEINFEGVGVQISCQLRTPREMAEDSDMLWNS